MALLSSAGWLTALEDRGSASLQHKKQTCLLFSLVRLSAHRRFRFHKAGFPLLCNLCLQRKAHPHSISQGELANWDLGNWLKKVWSFLLLLTSVEQ